MIPNLLLSVGSVMRGVWLWLALVVMLALFAMAPPVSRADQSESATRQVLQGSISSSVNHSCVVLASGKVRCWGRAQLGYGQLGYGNDNNIGDDEVPASAGDVNVGGAATTVSTGDTHRVRC